MANAGRLERWTDPVLGDFLWDKDEGAWKGVCEFNGHIVSLNLDPDNNLDPTIEEQLAIFDLARPITDRLRDVERELRRLAAKEIAEAVVSQQEVGPDRVILREQQFIDGLVLQTISIHDGGEGDIHYNSFEFFPGHQVTIHFDADLSFGGAEVYK